MYPVGPWRTVPAFSMRLDVYQCLRVVSEGCLNPTFPSQTLESHPRHKPPPFIESGCWKPEASDCRWRFRLSSRFLVRTVLTPGCSFGLKLLPGLHWDNDGSWEWGLGVLHRWTLPLSQLPKPDWEEVGLEKELGAGLGWFL